MADVRELLIRATGDSRDAEASLNRIARAMLRTARLEANPKVGLSGIAKAQAELAAFEASLKGIDRTKVSAEVNVQIDRSLTRIELLKNKLANLWNTPKDKRGADFSQEVGRVAQSIATEVGNMGTALASAAGPTNQLNGAFSGVLGAIKQVNPILQGTVLVVSTLLVPAFLALVAALAATVAAVGALATAFVAMLGPVIGGLVAVFSRISAILKVRQMRQQAMNSETRKGAQADEEAKTRAEALRNAHNSVRDALEARRSASRQVREAEAAANQGIADAQRDAATAAQTLKDATVDAYRAMRDAVEDVKDSVRELASAQLGVEESKLATKQAVADLKKLGREAGLTGQQFNDLFSRFEDVHFNPAGLRKIIGQARAAGTIDQGSAGLDFEAGVLRVARARLNEKDATDRVHDSTVALGDARKREAEFTKRGIAAYAPYAAAARQAADADRKLAEVLKQGVAGNPQVIAAHNALRDARQRVKETTHDLKVEQEKADAGMSASASGPMALYKKALDGLSASERRLLDLSIDLPGKLRKAVQPGTDAFINGVANGVAKIGPKLGPLAAMLNPILATWGKNVQDFLTDLATDPKWGSAFKTFADAAGRVSKIVGGPAFRDFFALLRNVAVAAMPFLIRGFEAVAAALHRWREGTENGDKLGKTIARIMGIAKQAFGFIGALVNVFFALGDAGGEAGGGMLKSLTGAANGFAKFLRSAKGSDQVKRFFKDTLPAVKSLGTLIAQLAIAFLQALQFIAPAIKFVLDGFILLVKVVNFVLSLLNRIPAPIRALLGLFFPFGTVLKLAFAPFKLLGRIPGLFRGISRAVGLVRRVFGPAFAAIRAVLEGFFGFFRRGLNVLPRIVRRVGSSIRGIWKRVTDFFGSAFNVALGVIRAAVNFLIDGLNVVIGLLNKIHVKVPKIVPGIGGTEFGFNLPTIPHLASGGITTGATLAQIGEAGREAVLPLRTSVLRALGQSIVAAMPHGIAGGRAGAAAGGMRGGITVERVILPPSPAAPVQDARTQAVKFAQELARRGA
jgi:hypothetical protein